MSQALQTDVAILSMAYGRREPHSPTARVIEPARGIAPAEGKGNLYILVELEGSDQGRTRLYREILNTIQESYYTSNDDITGALTEALRTVHGHIQRYNQSYGTGFIGGATCLVATGSEIISAQAGPTILAVRSHSGLQWFSPLNDEHYVPLGDTAMPSIEIGRVAGHPGVVIVAMNSAWANYLEVSAMMEATEVPRAQAVTDQLAGIGIDAADELTILVVTLNQPDPARVPQPVPAEEEEFVISVATPSSAIPAAKPSRWDEEFDEEVWEEVGDDEGGASAAVGGAVAGLGSRLRGIRVERKPVEPSPEPKRRGPARRIPFVLAIILLLGLAVVAVTAGTWYIQGQQRIRYFTQYLDGAKINFNAAMGAADENQARLYLEAAEEQLDQAALFAPEHVDVADMRNKIAEARARINHVVPLVAGFDQPLATFNDPDQKPHDVLVHGLNIYVLDTGRQTLERYQLDASTGDRLAGDGEPELLLQSGTTVGARTVGELAEAVWAPAAGNRTSTGPLVLDRSNQLFEVSDALGPVNVPMAENDSLGFASDLYFYAGNLYILDTKNSQLWRYRPTGESYSEAPEPYFIEESGVNLSTVKDAAIDGSVWLLHPNGTVLKYFTGVQEAFALDVVNPDLADAVEIWANEGDPPGGRLYIADAASNRILVFNKEGKLLSQLMPVDYPGVLNDLQSFYVDEVSNYMYILTSSALYQVPLPPIEELG